NATTLAMAENLSRCTCQQCAECNAAMAVARSITIAMRQGHCTFHNCGAISQRDTARRAVRNQAIATSACAPHNFFSRQQHATSQNIANRIVVVAITLNSRSTKALLLLSGGTSTGKNQR